MVPLSLWAAQSFEQTTRIKTHSSVADGERGRQQYHLLCSTYPKQAHDHIRPMLGYWWYNFCDAGPTLSRPNLNVSCLMHGIWYWPSIYLYAEQYLQLYYSLDLVWFVMSHWLLVWLWMTKKYKHEYKHLCPNFNNEQNFGSWNFL